MAKLRMTIKYKMVPDLILFKDKERINKSALHEEVNRHMPKGKKVSRATITNWVLTGEIKKPEKYMEALKKVNDKKVITAARRVVKPARPALT